MVPRQHEEVARKDGASVSELPVPKKEYLIELGLNGSFFATYFRGQSRVYAKDRVSLLSDSGRLLPCGWYMAQHDFYMDWDGNVVRMTHPYRAHGEIGPCGVVLPMKLRTLLENINADRVQWMREKYAKYDDPDGSYGEHP